MLNPMYVTLTLTIALVDVAIAITLPGVGAFRSRTASRNGWTVALCNLQRDLILSAYANQSSRQAIADIAKYANCDGVPSSSNIVCPTNVTSAAPHSGHMMDTHR
eukprot:NODE_13438_length_476_cov_79.889518_g13145_i0.p1 GENE.NODE_13438_length_476_cov_79.889518_g13145_i0~~NODE_13438_length_476_cov_79.889518_g13145_i0.p1  ORF type:complete len:105 (-),score=7.11 NODE_13438_length_476_cov_79.889518_g13145_i0:109-423(-)